MTVEPVQSVESRTILAIDLGTTNAKALLVDGGTGTVVARGASGVGIAHPAPGHVEQDADDLWAATLAAIETCLDQAPGVMPGAVAISNQRESVVVWSKVSGEPLGPVLGWQDARTAETCAALIDAGHDAEVRRRTGLALDAMYSAPKMRWLLEAVLSDGATELGDVCLGTVDAWLVWRLTGGAVFATEAGNASRTLLLDLADLTWNDALLDLFGIPASALPEVRASDAGFGETADLGVLPAGIPVVAVLADSHSALYHHGCTGTGSGKATYGTGSSVMTPCAGPQAAPDGVTTTLAWLSDGVPTYAREGNILASGSALDWMAATLGAPREQAGGAFLTDLAAGADDDGGVAFVPAFSGLGAPYWDRSAVGVLVGVTGGTTRAHLARAALAAVAHQVADVVEAIESDGGARIDLLHADGGATASGLLMQTQADLLGRPVRVAPESDASALGVARLAARALGLVESPSPTAGDGAEDDLTADQAGAVVLPSLSEGERAVVRARWADAVARSRGRMVPSASPHRKAPDGA